MAEQEYRRPSLSGGTADRDSGMMHNAWSVGGVGTRPALKAAAVPPTEIRPLVNDDSRVVHTPRSFVRIPLFAAATVLAGATPDVIALLVG